MVTHTCMGQLQGQPSGGDRGPAAGIGGRISKLGKSGISHSVFHPDILARGGKVEFWECKGGRRERPSCAERSEAWPRGFRGHAPRENLKK